VKQIYHSRTSDGRNGATVNTLSIKRKKKTDLLTYRGGREKKGGLVCSYQYSNVRYGTTDSCGRFLRSASHRAIHAEIFARLAALSTLTVATMRTQSSDSAKHVSSKNELCSEYGTPKSCADGVEPREGHRCACVNSRCGGCARMDAMEGVKLVPAGGE